MAPDTRSLLVMFATFSVGMAYGFKLEYLQARVESRKKAEAKGTSLKE